jgi:thiol:disulfide interchange protein DsbD
VNVHRPWRLLAFSCVAAAVPSARADVPAVVAPPGRHVTVSLVSEDDAVQPGKPLTVGIRLQMQPGWHTYWRNPGDSGLPTRARWTLPAGFEAGEIRWPRPMRFKFGPVQSFGYEMEVVLPVEIKVPASAAGLEVRLAVHVDWLECQEACLPGKADLSLALPVRATARPGPQAALVAAARALLPATDSAWRFSAAPSGDAVVLTVQPPRGSSFDDAWFYPLLPHVLDHAKAQQAVRGPAGYRITLTRDPNGTLPDRLQGVLALRAAGVERALVVDARMGANTTTQD